MCDPPVFNTRNRAGAARRHHGLRSACSLNDLGCEAAALSTLMRLLRLQNFFLSSNKKSRRNLTAKPPRKQKGFKKLSFDLCAPTETIRHPTERKHVNVRTHDGHADLQRHRAERAATTLRVPTDRDLVRDRPARCQQHFAAGVLEEVRSF